MAIQYFVTTSTSEATALLKRLDTAFGYPNGNAQQYGTVIQPYDTTELRVAVVLEDRCMVELSTSEKSKVMATLPAKFHAPLPAA